MRRLLNGLRDVGEYIGWIIVLSIVFRLYLDALIMLRGGF